MDYLPVWADYSYCDMPTRLIWHGLFPRYQYPKFFGAVVLFNKQDIVKVNGYSNEYWGWGFEDEELRERCALAGLSLGARDGTFRSLAHDNVHFDADGSMTAKGEANKALFEERMKNLREVSSLDGVSSLEYQLKNSSNISINSKVRDNIFHHKVEI